MELYLLHERRQDYLRKFQKVSTPLFLEGVYSIYANVKRHNKVNKQLLKEFQQSMFDVSLWSKDIISKEYERFQSKVPSINKYIQVVFETDKILRKGHANSAPKPSDFIHQCYLNIARALWKQPFLMYDINVTKLTLQKNKLKVERIVNECIQDTFVQYLPLEPDGDDGLSDYVVVHDELEETFSHSSEIHESDAHESDIITYDDTHDEQEVLEQLEEHVPEDMPKTPNTILQEADQDEDEYLEQTPEEQEECESQQTQEEEGIEYEPEEPKEEEVPVEDISTYDISQVPISSDTVHDTDVDADNIRIVNVQDGRERTRDTLLSLKKRVKSSIHRHTASKSFF